jgi:hypothetical protein
MNAQIQSKVVNLDAPVEGWDAFHALDAMPPAAAVQLDNLIPSTGSVRTREGHVVYADLGTGLPVESVASFDDGASSKLIAASNGGVWDITDSGVIRELAAESTFTSDRWQTANFRKADEAGVMIMCNGADNTQVFNGTALTDLVDTNTVGTDFIGCVQYKGRMYYWKDDDNAFYYAPAGSYQGTLEKFDLGAFAQLGGKIMIAATWTQTDSGDGKDDFLVFIFSTGEVLIYQGDDPENIGYWEMVGRYFMAEPITPRGYSNYGTDLIVITRDGYVNLSSVVQQGRSSDVPQFSRLIHKAIKKRTETSSSNFGWDVRLFQKKGLMIFNVPLSATTMEQHVLNTVTMRWCRFINMNPICLETHNERLFGGSTDGRVFGILESTSDLGGAIYFTAQYAFNYLEAPGYQKHMVSAQVLSTNQNPELIEITGYADFQLPKDSPLTLPSSGIYAVWDQSAWGEDYWALVSDAQTTKGWHNAAAFGYAVSLRVRFALVEESAEWRSTGLRYHLAGAQ